MGRELGRISGPLLSANLLRKGKVEAGTENLAFHNASIDDNFLYIDVINDRIGIRTDGPSQRLDVNGTTRTTKLIARDSTEVNLDLTIDTNRIKYLNGTIIIQPDQSSNPTVTTTRIGTANLRISDKLIENITLNSDIELTANGNGKVIFNTSTLNVNGNLHATGDITWEGNITFGNNDDDNVTFESDVASDLLPDVSGKTLGTISKRWKNVYADTLNTNSIVSSSATINGIDLLLAPANMLYVSVNGSDSNIGTHPQATFKTIKRALLAAEPGTTIFVYPGTYYEEFPLTVPFGVSLDGESLRSVIVAPTGATNHNDAFLLNGETTINNITVSHFYYDSENDTGYAFRLAPGCKVVYRSPYIRNVSVLTRGTPVDSREIIDGGAAITALFAAILEGGGAATAYLEEVSGGPAAIGLSSDLWFDSGDAGRGALVDGSVVDPDSIEATILFHSVTFIVPNADGITATNGARVEWLDSFTYFANRGIHLTEGTLGFASLGTRFGAEMRSINSANVYGNYGAVADGEHTLGYLIGHNFGYVGSGSNSQNDTSQVIQANEIVKLNSGVIYYDSMDHKGDYRIGDVFYVNQETGRVIFDAQRIDFSAQGSIVLEGPSSTTTIDATQISTGNIRIHDNNIDSTTGPVNFSARTGTTTLNTDVNVTGSIGVTGDVLVKGNLFLGDNPLDTVTIAPLLTQDITPKSGLTLSLGNKTSPKIWNTAFVTGLDIDSILSFENNTVSVLTSNTNLQIDAHGTGIVSIPTNSVDITNNLTVDTNVSVLGNSVLQDIDLTGNILQTGNIVQTGDTFITGNTQYNNIDVDGFVELPGIKINSNAFSVLTPDTDLVFSANGTGNIVFENYLKVSNSTFSNVKVSPANNTERSVQLSPNGLGGVEINSVRSLVLPYGNDTNRPLAAIGEIRQNSTTKLYEGWSPSGLISFNDVYDGDRNTFVKAETAPYANNNVLQFTINSASKATVVSTAFRTNTIHSDNINISGNIINNLVSSTDITVDVTGTGVINFNWLDDPAKTIVVKDDVITNNADEAFVIANTGRGFTKFAGTGAVRFPAGPTEDRRVNPELGELRFNTTIGYMEVFNGTAWSPVNGNGVTASRDQVEEISFLYELILG